MQHRVPDQRHEPVDLTILRQWEDDQDAAARTALEFVRTSREHVARARECALMRDVTTVLDHLHRLRGLLALLGADRPHRSTTAARRAARIGSWTVAVAWLDEVAGWLEHAEQQLAAA